MNQSNSNYLLLLTGIHFLLLLAMAIIAFCLLYKLTSKKTARKKEKWIAIGFTAILFKNTVYSAFVYPVVSLVSNLQQLLGAYSKQMQPKGEAVAEKVENPIVYNNGTTFLSAIEGFPLAYLLAASAFCLLLYSLILYFKEEVKVAPPPAVPAPSKSIALYNMIIICTLMFSLFLVISVFITIPYLNEARKPSVFSLARLDSTLNRLSSRDSFKVPEARKEVFFTELTLDTVIAHAEAGAAFAKLPQPTKQSIIQLIERYNIQSSNYKTDRQRALESLKAFAENYKGKEDAYKRKLQINFESALQSSTTDKAFMFQDYVAHFDNYVLFNQLEFNNKINNIRRSDEWNEYLKNRFLTDLREAIILKSTESEATYASNSLYLSEPAFSAYPSQAMEIYSSSSIPVYKKDGSEWGFFGWISRYLIKTQSSELVLLIGMFGFGLLGASLLSFEAPTGFSNFIDAFKYQPMIKGFGGALARGFGAALVVYLATKGGLAIFSAGSTTDPNGYVLLLTCFIGAIYSEKVWNKIKDTI